MTGAKADYFEHEVPAEKTLASDNLVCFHQKYLEYRWECGDEGVLRNVLEGPLKAAVDELFDDNPCSCTEGSIDRPQGFAGVFVATFADPETTQATALREVCTRCASTEADTLLVELANILKGSVTVGEDSRFRALCDVAVEDEHLLSEAREQHDTFEAILDKRGEVHFKEKVARQLYLGGVRGSLYHTFLSRFLGSSNIQSRLDSLGLAVDRGRIGGDNTVRYIFETLCPATSDESLPPSHSESDTPLPRTEEGFASVGRARALPQ